MLLYHGTSEANLEQILKNGIIPRSDNPGNWAHTVNSNEDAVYLSIAYPLHFANQACEAGERLVVLEIDTDLIDESLLVSDEDAVEQTLRGRDELPSSWNMEKRTQYYRDRISQYSYEQSLKALGSCAHLGPIDAQAITRVAYVSLEAFGNMRRCGYDPSISVMAYQVIGETYRKSTIWLFDPETVEPEYINLGDGRKYSILPILDTREGIHVQNVAK
jgi:hypothetical protein